MASTGLKQQCPHCDAMVSIREELVGKRIKCPKCGEGFRVEDPDGAPAASESPRGPKAAAAAKGPAAKTKPGTKRFRGEEEDEDRPEFKKKKSGEANTKLLLGLGLAVVALAGLGVAGYFLFFNGGDSKKTNTPSAANTNTGPGRTPAPTPTPEPTATKPEQGATTPASPPGNPISNMLPPDTQTVSSLSLPKIRKNTLGEMALDNPALSRALGFPVDSIDQMIWATHYTEPPWGFLILRTTKPIKSEAVQQAMRLKSAGEAIMGQDYYQAPFTWTDVVRSFIPPDYIAAVGNPAPVAVRLHDPHTLVMANVDVMKKFLVVKGQFPFQDQQGEEPAPTAPGGRRGGGTPTPTPTPSGPSEGGPGQAPAPVFGKPGTPGGGRPSGPRGSPVPGQGAGTTPASNNYRTIKPSLKAMMDLVETNNPFLLSEASDLTDLDIAFAGGQDLKKPITVGLSFQWDEKTVLMAGLEFEDEQAATNLKQEYDKNIQTLVPLARMFGVRINTSGQINRNRPNQPGTSPSPSGPGRPPVPGGERLPGRGAPRPDSPGPGAGAPPPPRVGGPGSGRPPAPRPGIPGAPGAPFPGGPGRGPGSEPEVPAVVTLTPEVKQQGKVLVATVDIEMEQRFIDEIYKEAQPYLTRYRGEMEMASTRPNLHKVGAATQQFGAKDKALPAGTFPRKPSPARVNRPWPPDQRVSWMANLLPFMDYDEIRNKIDVTRSWKDPDNLSPASLLIPHFLAPDAPHDSWYVRYPGMHLETAATHFVGMAGIGLDAASYSTSDPAVAAKLGVFGYDRSTRLGDIESLAKTIFMIQVPAQTRGPWLAGGGSTIRGLPEKDGIKAFASPRADGKRGAYVLMTDGSVRWVADNIADEVLKDLARIKGRKLELEIEKTAPKVPPPQDQPELKTIAAAPKPPAKEEPKPAPASPLDRLRASNDLKALVLAYHQHLDQKAKPPAGPEDLAPLLAGEDRLLQALRQGQYVFIYKASLAKMTAGTSNTVLAYEKDAPTKGGLVAMADGSVKTMTPQEFQAAPKAQPG